MKRLVLFTFKHNNFANAHIFRLNLNSNNIWSMLYVFWIRFVRNLMFSNAINCNSLNYAAEQLCKCIVLEDQILWRHRKTAELGIRESFWNPTSKCESAMLFLLSTCNPDTAQVVIRDASTCNPDTLHVVIRDASTCNPDTDDGFLWYKTAIPGPGGPLK